MEDAKLKAAEETISSLLEELNLYKNRIYVGSTVKHTPSGLLGFVTGCYPGVTSETIYEVYIPDHERKYFSGKKDLIAIPAMELSFSNWRKAAELPCIHYNPGYTRPTDPRMAETFRVESQPYFDTYQGLSTSSGRREWITHYDMPVTFDRAYRTHFRASPPVEVVRQVDRSTPITNAIQEGLRELENDIARMLARQAAERQEDLSNRI